MNHKLSVALVVACALSIPALDARLLAMPSQQTATQNPNMPDLTPSKGDALKICGTSIGDVVHIPFKEILENKKSQWALAEAKPAFPGVPKMMSDEEVAAGSANLSYVGQLDFALYLNGNMGKNATEPYEVAAVQYGPLVERVRLSPFAVGGVALLQIHPEKKRAARYSQIYWIPASLVKSVAPAFAFFRDNPALWDEKRQIDWGGVSGADRTAARLVASLDDDNPLIAAWSCRRLLQTGKLPSGAAEKLLQASEKADDPLRVALMADTLLEFSDEKARPEIVALIAKRVEAAPTLNALHGLLLGAWSGGVAQSVDPEGNRSAPPLALKANVRRRYLTRNTAGASASTMAKKPNANEEAVLGILQTYGMGTE